MQHCDVFIEAKLILNDLQNKLLQLQTFSFFRHFSIAEIILPISQSMNSKIANKKREKIQFDCRRNRYSWPYVLFSQTYLYKECSMKIVY